MNENTDMMTAGVQNEGAQNIHNTAEEKEEKLFTQSQLEEVIRERLMRERKTNESLVAVKNFLKSASEKGVIGKGSYSDMASELVQKLKDSGTRREAETDTSEICPAQETPAVADADGEKHVTNDGKEKRKDEGSENGFFEILSDIKSRYPEKALKRMLEGNSFERFAKGRSGSIGEIFDDYYAFMEDFSKGEAEDAADDGHALLASTAFSSHSGASDTGAKLTKQQMEIAKSAGMSYREYAALLDSVPKKTGRVF